MGWKSLFAMIFISMIGFASLGILIPLDIGFGDLSSEVAGTDERISIDTNQEWNESANQTTNIEIRDNQGGFIRQDTSSEGFYQSIVYETDDYPDFESFSYNADGDFTIVIRQSDDPDFEEFESLTINVNESGTIQNIDNFEKKYFQFEIYLNNGATFNSLLLDYVNVSVQENNFLIQMMYFMSIISVISFILLVLIMAVDI